MGFDTVDSKFYSLIDVWKSWYDGDVKDFHSYTVWNGIEELECHRYSVNMGKKICEDWANLLMNERVNITLEGKKEQEFVDAILADNNWEVKSNESQERKAAVGTIAYVPIVEEMGVDPDTAEVKDTGKIHINYVTAANIYPLTWDNGVIRECAFVSRKRVDDREYTYIQVHRLNGGEYDIENHLYDAEEVPLTSVRGFETIPPVVHTGSDKPQFVIDRLNIANSDEENPMGVAVFAYAIDQLKSICLTYYRASADLARTITNSTRRALQRPLKSSAKTAQCSARSRSMKFCSSKQSRSYAESCSVWETITWVRDLTKKLKSALILMTASSRIKDRISTAICSCLVLAS